MSESNVEVVLLPYTEDELVYEKQWLAALRECYPQLTDEQIRKGFKNIQKIWTQDPDPSP